VPMKMSVREEVFPVGNVLVNRQGKADAFESCAVRRNPLPPSLGPLVIGSPSIAHSGPPISTRLGPGFARFDDRN
jgi:hypothetical protein